MDFRHKSIKVNYLQSRASECENMPFSAKRHYDEIIEIERQLDELCPGWDNPLRFGNGQKGMQGLQGFKASCKEELGEIKRLLLLRKLRWNGRLEEVIVSYCAKTGKPVAVPVTRK